MSVTVTAVSRSLCRGGIRHKGGGVDLLTSDMVRDFFADGSAQTQGRGHSSVT